MPKYRAQSTTDSDVADARVGGLSPAAGRLLWIVAYYVVAGLAVAALWRTYPQIRALLEANRLSEIAVGDPFSRSDVAAAAGETSTVGALNAGWFTLFALGGALAAALPVAWVYSLTRRRKGFDQSMVHTLILLPLAIAGMVVLIQNSLALAFSLAGIVAVLRFRNTLEDTKDGVYIFIVTCIGISAAVGALVVGAATSIVFNVCVLILWWSDFARKPTPGIRGGIRRLARLPKVGAGRAVAPATAPNSGGWAADEVFATAAEAWRRQLRVTAEHRVLDPQGKFNGTLRVHTLDPGVSQPIVERLLSERAKRWELVGILPGDAGRFTLKYLVRLRKNDRGELLSQLRQEGAPQMVGVEFR